MTNDIKLAEQQPPASEPVLDSNKLLESFNVAQTLLSHQKTLADYLVNFTIEGYFILCNYFSKTSTTSKETTILMKKLKDVLVKPSDPRPTSQTERWHLAQYHCLNYELDKSISNLNTAYTLIKTNPQPTLYRRLCSLCLRV